MELNITEFIKKETNLKDGNKLQEFTERELNILIYKALKEQLILSGVSQRSEQLIDFVKWFETLSAEELVWYDGRYAEIFMAINCG